MTSVDLTEPAEDFPAQKCGSCGGAPVWCWCVDCNEALCHDCMSAHRRVTVTRRHKLLDQAPPEVRSIAPTKFCSLHPSETLQLFCFRCNQMTCRDCQLVAHKNHSFEFISKAVESLKKQLGSSIDPLQEQMQASRRSIVEMEERLAVLSQHETFITTKLQNNFSALAEFLSRRLEKVLKEVQKVHDWERQKIRRRMLEVKQLQQSCMAVTAAAVQAQNLSDLLELLGCMAQIKPQVKDLISQDSAPPKTMACLKVISDQQSMDSILQFGKIEVSWVPFSAYQAPKKDTSCLHEVAPPTTCSSFNGIAPPTSSSSISGITPPTSSSSFNGIAPPTSSSSFNGIAPSTSSSLSGVAPPTSSSSISGVAPPTSSTCSSFSSETPPPLVSHISAPSLLSLSSWRPSTYAPPVHTTDAPPAPPPAPPDPKKANDSVCSSQLAPPFAPLPAQTHPTPTLLVNYPAPPSTSLDPLGVTPPQTSAAASSKVRINIISRSEVAALSRLLEWPQKHHKPPKKKPARSSDPQGRRSAAFRKHPPKKTKSSGGASTLLFHSLAPQSKNLTTTSSSPPCSPPITPAVTPEPPSQQQPSVFAPGGLAASKPTAPSLPSPPPSTPLSRSALAPPPPYPQIPLKDQEPPHRLQRESASLQPGSFVTPPRPKTPPPPHPSLRDRPPSQEEPSPHPGSCRGGPGSSASEPSEPEAEPAPAFPVEPEPPEKPAPPPASEEPTSVPCGGLDPDGTPARKLAAGTGGGGAPRSRDSRLLQPRVSLFRLPVSWSGPDRPLPRFQLIHGDAEDEIYMQEISQVETDGFLQVCEPEAVKPTTVLVSDSRWRVSGLQRQLFNR
uniref:B box-type domain-containing protein n=1 Tax=Oryzias latipes TaxID=8090 RepID=A0A3P9I578_ORYLA